MGWDWSNAHQVISFIVAGLRPVPKGRPRVQIRGRGNRCPKCHRASPYPHIYTPDTTAEFEKKVAGFAAETLRQAGYFKPLDVNLIVELIFTLSWPTRVSKKAKAAVALEGFPDTIGPDDLDNYIKSTLDGLNGVVFTDDRKVVELHCKKVYGDRDCLQVRVLASGINLRLANAARGNG